MSGFVNLVEGIDGIQNRLQFVHFHGGVEHFVEVEVKNLTAASDDVSTLFLRGNHATAVKLNVLSLSNEAELDRVPEETAKPLLIGILIDLARNLRKGLKIICKNLVRVHGNVPEHVVKNVRRGGVVERIGFAYVSCGGKNPCRKQIEKRASRKKTAHGQQLPMRPLLQHRIQLLNERHACVGYAEHLKALEIL